MARLPTEITSGPIPTRSQATQTLLVQTQIPTQLASHEVHQFTQLINHESPEHVGGDTLVIDSDSEGSGNTVILHDDEDDDDAHGGAESGPLGKAMPSLQGRRDADSHDTPPCETESGPGKSGLHFEVHDVAPSKLMDDSVAPLVHRDLPHSDSTTEEEGDIEKIGYLVADAESQPPHIDATLGNKGVSSGGKIVQPAVVTNQGNSLSLKTPEAASVADTTGKKSSLSRRPSIASVRAESLHASGLRAASRGASIGSEGKDDGNLDSVDPLGLTDGMSNGELRKPLEALEAELENPCVNKAADVESMQISPKVTLAFDGMMVRSPSMSTSRSKSKVVSLGCALQQHALEQECMDSSTATEANMNLVEGVSRFGRVVTGMDQTESTSAPLELPSLGLRRLRSQASIVSSKKPEQVESANDVNATVQPRQASHQKPRKLVFDIIDTSPVELNDRLQDGGNADPKALKNVVDALAKDRQSSLPSGVRAASANLSYLESQEPGEESQANALNIIDKLMWLDATCMSDEVVTSPMPQDSALKGLAGSKGRQSLAQAAQMKIVHDKLDVFDWEDSQVDEGVPHDTKQVAANTKARKRNLEDFDNVSDRKRRVAPQQQKSKTTLCLGSTGENVEKEKRMTPNVGKVEASREELTSNQEVKAHTLLTTRLRNRIKADSRPSVKGRKSPGSKSESVKHVCKEKQTNDAAKDFEPEHKKADDDKVQQEGHMKCESRNQADKKELVDESGKELESEEKSRKGRKSRQADSLSAKKKSESFITLEVGPSTLGDLAVADRPIQGDETADLWIEAFTNSENKTRTGGTVEMIKFRKRSALHELTRQDSKKCRTTEPSTVTCNEEYQDTTKKEEASMKAKRIKPHLSVEKASEKIYATAYAQIKATRAGTQLSKKENQEIEKKEDNVKEQLIAKSKPNSKKLRIANPPMVSQVKGRRARTRSSQGEYQDVFKPEERAMEEDEAEQGPKTRQGQEECKTAYKAMTAPVRSRGASNCASAAELIDVENAREDDMLEGGSKTRSRAQDAKNTVVVAGNAKEGIRDRKSVVKSRTTKATSNDMDEPSLSKGAMLVADFDTKKPHMKTSSSKKREESRSHQHLTTKLTQDAQDGEASSCKVESSGLLTPSLGIDGSIGTLAGRLMKGKRRGQSSNVIVLESTKAAENPGSWLKDPDKDQLPSKMKDPVCKQGDVSSTILLRRTRSSLSDGGSQKNDVIDAGKTPMQIQGDPPTDRQSPQKHINSSDAKKGLIKQTAKSATKATTKSVLPRIKKTRSLEMLNSFNFIEEGRRRKRESGCIRVLFSHSLTEETIKHQKKILAKLGGQLAASALDCTHFVSNGFARSQNMLISMAAGKEVVTTLWLENCGQAFYFVDEKTYITQDAKKEKELGFSLVTSLASARRKPLLKGVRVLVGPNTVPEPSVLKAIVESAGGEVVDIKSWSPHLDEKESDTSFIIVANEKDFDFCVQFVNKGLKVYSEELLLHGIVTQTLDYSRHRLFEKSKVQKGRRGAANINA